MSSSITMVGRLVADPELRFTANGKPVCNFTLADDFGHRDRSTNEWVKDGTTFLRVEVWGDHAENCTELLRKGQRAIVTGEVRQRSYETRDGEKRTAFEIKAVQEVGVLVDKWAKREPSVDGGRRAPQQAEDPWGSAPANEEPAPF